MIFLKLKSTIWNHAIFYINADSENRFIRSLTDEGYGVFRANGTVVQSGYLSLRTLVLPIMILLTSMLFYFINKRKEYVIKLLEGYSKFLIVTETSCKTCAVMLPIGIIVICLSAFVTMMIYNIDPIDYIAFSIKGLAPFFSFTIISAFYCQCRNSSFFENISYEGQE